MIRKLSEVSPLREDQDRMLSAYILDGIKYGVLVAHRRYGKDYSCWALCWNAALLRPGFYLYLLPTIEQSTKVIWEARGEDGMTLIERIPPELMRRKPHNVKQQIYLRNGSIVRVGGADNYQRLRGTSPMGIVFSETQDLKSMEAYHVMRPALKRNKGWVCFNGTPRSYNELHDLYERAKNSEEWYSANLTINDTKDLQGNPIITQADIEEERRNGMPEELIRQEYFGDWSATLAGAYYSDQLQEARAESRIGVCKAIPGVPVHTGWDIGYSDYTAIWAIQVYGDVVYVLDYYEANRKQPEHYAKYIKTTWAKNRWAEGFNFFPHDAAQDRLGMDKNILAQMESNGLKKIMYVSRVKYQINNIVSVRHMFKRFRFNEETTKLGLKRLSEYHAAFNEKMGIHADKPRHDSSSHGADALATFVRGWMKNYETTVLSKVDEWASFYGR